MTVAVICIVIMMFIPLLCAAYAKFSTKGYDNRAPREFLENLEGKAKRAHYAQLNSFEAFAPFAVGVVVAQQAHASQFWIDGLAVSFIAARIAYAILYVQDLHVWRSIVWFVGLFMTVALYIVGL